MQVALASAAIALACNEIRNESHSKEPVSSNGELCDYQVGKAFLALHHTPHLRLG